MSLPTWKKRALLRAKTAKFERDQRVPYLRAMDAQEIVRMTGITTNASQLVHIETEGNRKMIDTRLAAYYAAKLAAASKRGDYGRFTAEVRVLNAEERAVEASLQAGKSAVRIEKISPDLVKKLAGIEAGRDVEINGLELPPELKAQETAE